MRDQASELRDQVHLARIITTVSGKGGVGKSLTTLNLAVALSNMGKRVLVFDMDVGFANLNILGDIESRKTLKDFFGGLKLKDIIEKTKYGFWLLNGGNSANDFYAFQFGERERLFSEFYEFVSDVDYILFDTGAGYSKMLDDIYTASDDFILVITPEPTAIMDGYTFVKLLSMKKPDGRFFLVVNMVNDLSEGRNIIERFEDVARRFSSLRFEKGFSILNDPQVRRSVREQIPFIISYKSIQPSLAILGLSSFINGNTNHVQDKRTFVDRIKSIFGLRR
ncbi:MAG: AAA family ATPase [Athalassotoga sp.]|uniref:nucleotide-binding protein n=1 Tax=Athalassotoga sp. TaxID=2022597 RepID=UPI003CFF963C